ncbi:hypothetical protein ABK046_47040, partial [Streptomyces caeruleatus]
VKGIATTFAGGSKAIHIGPNGATKCDIHGSNIKPGAYTDDIKIESATATVSFSGAAWASKITNPNNAQLIASFSDSNPANPGQKNFGE